MFGWFSRKKAPLQAEREITYLTHEARVKALVQLCREARHRVVLLSPFPAHAARLQEALRQRGVEAALRGGMYRAAAQAPDAIPLLTLAEFPAMAPSLGGGEALDVIQIERHPLRSHDDSIQEALESLPEGTRLRVLHSMEDGLFHLFNSNNRLEDLLRKLGLGADEALEHPMISGSLARAQERVREQVKVEQPASSFAEWRERNLTGPG